MIGLLAIGITWIIVGTAGAACPVFCIGGFSVKGTNSIEVESILKGLKNTDTTQPAYLVGLSPRSVEFFCSGAPDTKRSAVITPPKIGSVDTAQTLAITKNGRALSSIVFQDIDLLTFLSSEINPATDQPFVSCPDKETLLTPLTTPPRGIIVTDLFVAGFLFSCANVGGDVDNPITCNDGSGGPAGTPTDVEGYTCVPEAGADTSGFFNYSCTLVCNSITQGQCAVPQVLP
jgi:hypothetical protein